MSLLLVLARNRRLVLGLPVLAGVFAVLVTLLLPNWYTATSRLMPPQQNQSNAAAILGQLGALSAVPSQALGLKNPSDIYLAMLKSRTVADKLIERFDLKRVYGEDLYHYARKQLARYSNFSAGREGVITIEVEDKDPERAASLANAYIDELRHLTGRLAVSEAGQRRLFYQEELKKTKDDLAAAEMELKKFSQDSGIVKPQEQIGLSVATAAALRAQIAAKEIQLSGMRSFATESNPEILRTLRELSGLRNELAKMEERGASSKGDVMVPFGKAPEVALDYVRKYRDVKYFETLFEVLAKQYEIAKIDEAKDATLIQVLDLATTPEHKSWPRRSLIVVVTMLGAFVLAIVLAHVSESLKKLSRDDVRAGEIEEILAALSIGKKRTKSS